MSTPSTSIIEADSLKKGVEVTLPFPETVYCRLCQDERLTVKLWVVGKYGNRYHITDRDGNVEQRPARGIWFCSVTCREVWVADNTEDPT